MSEGLVFTVQAVDQFSSTFAQLDSNLKQVEESTQTLGSTSQSVGERVKGAFESVAEKLSGAGERVKAAMGLSEKSMGDLAKGMAGAAAAGLSFAGILDNVENMQLRVSKASNRLEDAQLRVEKAQAALNAALEKYGPGSEQAAMRAKELEAAQRDVEIATETLSNVQQDQVKGMTAMASQTIPMMVMGMATLYASMGPVGLAIAAITFAIQLFAKAWAENWLGIRDVLGPVVDGIIGTLQGMIKWVQDGVKWLQDAVDWWAKLLGLKREGESGASTQTHPAGPAAEGQPYGPGMQGYPYPGFQAGGLITRSGLAYLHEGETVIPAPAIPGPVTVNLTLNASVTGQADEERLARRVAEEIAFNLYRRQRTL